MLGILPFRLFPKHFGVISQREADALKALREVIDDRADVTIPDIGNHVEAAGKIFMPDFVWRWRDLDRCDFAQANLTTIWRIDE